MRVTGDDAWSDWFGSVGARLGMLVKMKVVVDCVGSSWARRGGGGVVVVGLSAHVGDGGLLMHRCSVIGSFRV